jgi:hypothetical protein
MKLIDLQPRSCARALRVSPTRRSRDSSTSPAWAAQRTAQVRLAVQFANPIGTDPKPLMTFREKHQHVHDLRTFDVPPGFLWTRSGETFENMSFSPSVDASASGHWHGYVTDGEVR